MARARECVPDLNMIEEFQNNLVALEGLGNVEGNTDEKPWEARMIDTMHRIECGARSVSELAG